MEKFYKTPEEPLSQCSTPYERLVLMELLKWEWIAVQKAQKTYTTSNGYISKTTKISVKTVERAKKSLKEKGLIDYSVNVKDDKTKETIYKVLQRKAWTEWFQESQEHSNNLENRNKNCIIKKDTSIKPSKKEEEIERLVLLAQEKNNKNKKGKDND